MSSLSQLVQLSLHNLKCIPVSCVWHIHESSRSTVVARNYKIIIQIECERRTVCSGCHFRLNDILVFILNINRILKPLASLSITYRSSTHINTLFTSCSITILLVIIVVCVTFATIIKLLSFDFSRDFEWSAIEWSLRHKDSHLLLRSRILLVVIVVSHSPNSVCTLRHIAPYILCLTTHKFLSIRIDFNRLCVFNLIVDVDLNLSRFRLLIDKSFNFDASLRC